jgi:hypothetical protein
VNPPDGGRSHRARVQARAQAGVGSADAPQAPSSQRVSRRWKTRAAALFERERLSRWVMWERDWRQLYIEGATPERAVEQARTH